MTSVGSRQVSPLASGGNGLAVSDDRPLEFFLQYARYYRECQEDWYSAALRGDDELSVAYLEFFTACWYWMAKAQAEKYAAIIDADSTGHMVLYSLGFDRYLATKPSEPTRQSRRRKVKG